ncbi:hypothetical protein DMENIID0001_149430 [Sergentomyia squamirostris]
MFSSFVSLILMNGGTAFNNSIIFMHVHQGNVPRHYLFRALLWHTSNYSRGQITYRSHLCAEYSQQKNTDHRPQVGERWTLGWTSSLPTCDVNSTERQSDVHEENSNELLSLPRIHSS